MLPKPEDIFALVRQAGDAARALRGSKEERKADGSEVSAADRASHNILLEGLARFGFPILSEESASFPDVGESPLWIVDPLDGTSDFLAGTQDWCVMVGLLDAGVPVLGVVYAPDLGVMWSAANGEGSFIHDRAGTQKLSVSGVVDPAQARMLMSASHPSVRADALAAALGVRTVPRGSIGVKLGLIAAGEAHLYWSGAPLGVWDVCAPQIILEEAGGTVTDNAGESVRYDSKDCRLHGGFAASNGALHQALLAAIPRVG